jgi:hypothetical protein
MRVFGFDLLAYPERLDHLKTEGERRDEGTGGVSARRDGHG